MKTLLIPTDFKLQSLNCIPQLAKQVYPHKLNVLMVHMLGITDSISELLMLSRRSAEYRHIPDAFYKACHEIRSNEANNVIDIHIEFFYGNTVAVFKNFLDANGVDAIVNLENYDYELLTEKSIDPAVLIYRGGKTIINADPALPMATEIAEPKEELEVQSV